MWNGKRYTAIVLAGGKGKRMNSDQPKQYLSLKGKPVLYYSLKAFQDSPVDQVILVTGAGEEAYCKEHIVDRYGFTKVSAIVNGGAQRYDSVWNGLKAIPSSDYVLIHDGARPMVTQKVILSCMEAVVEHQSCVTAVPVKDTIKVVDDNRKTKEDLDRSRLWSVQTPQTFSFELAYQSYEKLQSHMTAANGAVLSVPVTDDTMVVQWATGISAYMVEGSYYNIKITTPEDMILGEVIIEQVSGQ